MDAIERTVMIGSQKYTKVVCLDKPGAGGACHKYKVTTSDTDEYSGIFATVRFQNGPVKENGVNGIHNEDLMAIVIDRLEHFQRGDFACRENARALECLQAALSALQQRTMDRAARGVEGTSEQ